MEPDNEDQGDGMDNRNGSPGDSGMDAEDTDAEGLDSRGLSYADKKVWEQQERFLQGFGAGGNIMAGLKVAGVVRRTQERWRQLDKLGFRQRFEDAHKDYCDSLENEMQELIEGLKPGQNPLVLLARANAEMPAKYRPNAALPADETAKEILAELRRMARERRAPGGSMGPPVVVDHDNGGVMNEVDGILRRKQGQG